MQLISFLKKDFVKNVSTLITGSFISQAFFFLIIPVLTRLFDKDTFGIYLLFSSSIYILRPLTSLSLELVILIPKRNKDAVNLLFTSLFIGFILNSFLLVIICFLKDFILSYFNLKTLASSIYLIPLGLYLLNTIEVLNYWNNRKHFFINIALGNIEKSIVTNSFQVYTGLSSFKSIGLIPGYLLGLIIQCITLLLLSFRSVLKYFKHVTWVRMFYLLKKHKDVPIFNSLLSFSDRLSAELPIILIAIYFGVHEVALYGLAVKFLKTPPGFISEPLSQVFFNKASNAFNNKENLFKLIVKTYKNLFMVGLIIFSIILILSFFLSDILGEDWSNTGVFIRILLPLIFLAFLNSPISSIIIILKKQKNILGLDILKLLLRFGGIYIGYRYYNSMTVAILLFSFIGIIYNIFLMYYFLSISKKIKQ
ncbi:oligosaccharide flippase family protein [Polaribacter sp.]|nr:oligosaccharide flippase family protein [Polaribacter sp.]